MADALSKIEARALELFLKHGPTTCANLGASLWPDKPHKSNCSCPFARPAGAVIRRLKARGFVERDYVDGDPRTIYRLTWRGRDHLTGLQKATG